MATRKAIRAKQGQEWRTQDINEFGTLVVQSFQGLEMRLEDLEARLECLAQRIDRLDKRHAGGKAKGD